MARSLWKGYLRLSLVSVPVRAYSAGAAGGGTLHFNQLHESCHSRIRYQKVCPIHGEVPNDEIVKGYEYAKDQYVIVDPDEIDQLRPDVDRSINIDAFVRPDQVDPLYFAGSAYYLAPDGPAGQKPYALLHRAMLDGQLYCIAQVVMSGREQIVLLRPVDRLLAMMALNYTSQVRAPDAFRDEVAETRFSPKELDLTRSLIAATTDEAFDIARYQDHSTDRLRQMIEAKVEGKEIVAPPTEAAPEVINLMDALRASIDRAKAKQPAPAAKAKSTSTAKPRRTARKTG